MSQRLKRQIMGSGSYFLEPKGIQWIPSGSTLLDLALGFGGWAFGHVINIVGDKSTGKTLLAIEMCANFATLFPKGKIKYRERESMFDKEYASAIGMPLDRVDFGKKSWDTVEEFSKDIETTIAEAKIHKQPVLYILDSLDSLRSKKGGMADRARAMSEFFRDRVRDMEACKITLVIISQLRAKIGVMFGEKKERVGGIALDYFAAQIVWLSQVAKVIRIVGVREFVTGIRIRARNKKNKVGLPMRDAEFIIKFGYGIDDAESCLAYMESVKPDAKMLKNGTVVLPKVTKDRLKALNAVNDNDEYFRQLAVIHKETRETWKRVETSLLPKRQKYARKTAA